MRRTAMVLAILLSLTTLMSAGCAKPSPTPTPAAKPTLIPSPTPTSSPTPAPAAKPIELSLSSLMPGGGALDKHLVRWADKIKADSNGRLTIRVYPGATLTSAADTFPGITKGVCDIGAGFKYAYEKELGVTLTVFMVGVPNAIVAASIFNDIWKGFPEFRAEWTDVKVLWFSSSGPHRIHTTRKPVRTLEDLKGLQLRTPGKLQSENLAALGAIPVDIAMADLAIALQKGTVAGACGADETLVTYKLADVVAYTTTLSPYSSSEYFVAMNWDKFNSLSPELQKVINDSVEWGQNDCAKTFAQGDVDGVNYAKSLGHTFITLAPDEEKRWLSILSARQDKLAAEVDAKGFAGTKLLQFVRERIKYYTTK